MTLQELKADLLADGIIDAEEVAKLKEILYADGVIDKEEAEFLFEINDAVTGKENDRKFYNACISMDEAKKTYGCIDNKNNEAVIHVNLLNKPNDKTPF